MLERIGLRQQQQADDGEGQEGVTPADQYFKEAIEAQQQQQFY